MGAESLNLRRIAVIASGRDNKHVSLRELNPVKVRASCRKLLQRSAIQSFKLRRGASGEQTYSVSRGVNDAR